jgi:organic radical activating enzyme
MQISHITTGFIEVPELNTMNIYMTGCSLKCKDCHNPDLQDFNNPNASEITIHSLSDKINAHRMLIDGICWIGGEPLDQAVALRSYITGIKLLYKRFKHIVYTGYTIGEILGDPDKHKALKYVSLVKTGRWKGIPATEADSNQRFWYKSGNHWLPVKYREIKNLPW